jgi:hypothetical protein
LFFDSGVFADAASALFSILIESLPRALRHLPAHSLPFHFFFPSSLLYYMWLWAAEQLAKGIAHQKD